MGFSYGFRGVFSGSSQTAHGFKNPLKSIGYKTPRIVLFLGKNTLFLGVFHVIIKHKASTLPTRVVFTEKPIMQDYKDPINYQPKQPREVKVGKTLFVLTVASAAGFVYAALKWAFII